ncbi:MAG: nucleotidyltransferase domain-containing protein [Methanobacteriota archaeon]
MSNITMIPQDISEKRDNIVQIARRHGVLSIRLFGSCAKGEAKNESDVDLLITVGPEHSRWFPGGLARRSRGITRSNR